MITRRTCIGMSILTVSQIKIHLNNAYISNDRMQSIGIYEYESRHNVASYGFKEHHENAEWVTSHFTGDGEPMVHYFCLDTHNDSFAHWVLESGIYLPLFQLLKFQYPTLKIWLRNRRDYKFLFTSYFGIEDSDIVFSIDHMRNICYFPKPIMWFNARTNPQWEAQVEHFVSYFSKPVVKEFDVCLLPRQCKENSKNGDRIYDIQNIIAGLQTSSLSNTVLHTDLICDLDAQIDTIQKSKYVILTDGSPYWINGLFSRDATIIILGHDCHKLFNLLDRCKFIHSLILKHNKTVHTVRYHHQTDTVISDRFTWDDVSSLITTT